MKKEIAFLLTLTLLGCGAGGGGDEQDSTNVYTNCGNRIAAVDIVSDEELPGEIKRILTLKDGISITCNIGNDEVGTEVACDKCRENFNECSQNPGDNGLTDDSKCKEIYYECAEINGCDTNSETE